MSGLEVIIVSLPVAKRCDGDERLIRTCTRDGTLDAGIQCKIGSARLERRRGIVDRWCDNRDIRQPGQGARGACAP